MDGPPGLLCQLFLKTERGKVEFMFATGKRDLDNICSEKPNMLWKIMCHITKKRDLGMSPGIIFSLVSATNFSVESPLVDFLLKNVKMC